MITLNTGLRGTNSADFRHQLVRWWFAPLAAEMLRQNREYRSVALRVAQYWNDEADDAVHLSVVGIGANPRSEPEGDEDDWEVRYAATGEATRALTGIGWQERGYFDNYENIIAFGAYCEFGHSQESPEEEAYSDYAIAERDGDGVKIREVGRIRQSEFEDRFDVGFYGEGGREKPPYSPSVWSVRARWGESVPADRLLAALDAREALGDALVSATELLRLARRDPPETKRVAEIRAWLEGQERT